MPRGAADRRGVRDYDQVGGPGVDAEWVRRTVLIYRGAAVATFLAVLFGSLVCATESGAACPSWPGCYVGRLTPTTGNSTVEFSHRVIAFGALVLQAAAVWRGRRLTGSPALRWLPVGTLGASIASAIFGMVVVLFSLPKILGIIDVAAALAALIMMTLAARTIGAPGSAGAGSAPGSVDPQSTGTASASRSVDPQPMGGRAAVDTEPMGGPAAVVVTRLGWTAVGTVIVMHLLGIVVSAPGSFVRCVGWPVWQIIDSDLYPGVQGVRIGLGVLALAMLGTLISHGLRRPHLRVPSAVLAALLVAELVVGRVIVGQFTGEAERHVVAAAVYSMLAVAVLWAAIVVAARATRTPASLAALQRPAPAASPSLSR